MEGRRTALHDAAAFDCQEPIRFLLQKGVNVNVRDTSDDGDGSTPLHECARHGHVDCAKLLLDRNADINALDSSAATALHAAASRGDLPMVQLLVNPTDDVGGAVDDTAVSGGTDLSLQDTDGRTAWRRALLNDHTKVAQFLQKSWSDMINGKDGGGGGSKPGRV